MKQLLKLRTIFAVVLCAQTLTAVTSNDDFVIEREECVNGPAENCAKKWTVKGGPEYAGTQREQHSNQIFCSPSCTDLDPSAPSEKKKKCSFIVAMHGIHSNPGDQVWLMMGSVNTNANYNESDEYGGPFCISFVKSADAAWDYSCNKKDATYLYAHIKYVLEKWPAVDPQAVFLHGFSSGGIMIHNIMNTECRIEKLVAGVATYGSGNVSEPPTTNAAYAVVMPTHDNIVVYRYRWINDRAYPSCDCNAPGFITPGGCLGGSDYYSLQGEELTTAMAIVRGDSATSVFDPNPLKRAQKTYLNLIEGDVGKCEERVNNCMGPYTENVGGLTCATLPPEETVVHDFVVNEDGAGPVQLWEVRLRNHDYPDKRREPWGATEFFIELRKFFNKNRGIKNVDPGATRSIESPPNGQICQNHHESLFPKPQTFLVKSPYSEQYTESECEQHCLRERRCKEAFYFSWDFIAFYCEIYYTPCSQYVNFSRYVKHFKAKVDYEPTPSPTGDSTTSASPSSSQLPTGKYEPSASPSERPSGICLASQTLVGTNQAGFSCDSNTDDSNFGGTEEKCNNDGGNWIPYDCATANSYYESQGGHNGEHSESFLDAWNPKCCEGDTTDGFCSASQTLLPSNPAGYSCSPHGNHDSNFGGTKEKCDDDGGDWVPYTCNVAHLYFIDYNGEFVDEFRNAWQPLCCEDTTSPAPSVSSLPTPEDFCSAECNVNKCTWSGQNGPGWDPTWTGDDGIRTKNGYCIHHCSPEFSYVDLNGATVYARWCGDTAWHRDGVDCSNCAEIAENPIIPAVDRAPSNGLCKEVTALSGHALWGTAMKECRWDQNTCTVYQKLNGDNSINPLRTCRSFCENFGMKCVNGFDDGNGCTYGGEGIGCDDVLGCCSEGAPTPDHVCECGRKKTENSSSQPSFIPSRKSSIIPSSKPSSIPSSKTSSVPSDTKSPPADNRSNPPSGEPSNKISSNPSDIPSKTTSNDSSNKPSDKESDTPSDMLSDIPSLILSSKPSSIPSDTKSLIPSNNPSYLPSGEPSNKPSVKPSDTQWSGSSPVPSIASEHSESPTEEDIPILSSSPSTGHDVELSCVGSLQMEIGQKEDITENFVVGVEKSIEKTVQTESATVKVTSINGNDVESFKSKASFGVDIEFILMMKVNCDYGCGTVLEDPSSLIGDALENMSDAVTSGSFMNTLIEVAEEIGVPTLANVIVDQSSLNFQDIVVTTSEPTSSPSVEMQSSWDLITSLLEAFVDIFMILIALIGNFS